MATSAANVKVGVTGSVSVAPLGTTTPTAPQTTLDAAFADLGYISDAGVTESTDSSTNKIKAWQGGDVVREIQTEHNLTYQFTAIETNPVVLAEFYGNYVTGDVEINSLQPEHKEWVLDVIDGSDLIRVVIPFGQVTERGDLVYVNADVIGYPFTVSAFPDPNYAGALNASAKAYKYLYDVSGGVT